VPSLWPWPVLTQTFWVNFKARKPRRHKNCHCDLTLIHHQRVVEFVTRRSKLIFVSHMGHTNCFIQISSKYFQQCRRYRCRDGQGRTGRANMKIVLSRMRSKTATAFSLVSQYYRSILECNISMVTVICLRALGANCEGTRRKIQNTNSFPTFLYTNMKGRLKTRNWHRETIKIVRTDIARLDNARPYSKGGHRETWQRGTRSNISVHFLCCMEYYMNVTYHTYHFVTVFFVICACILLYITITRVNSL